ncbi:DUF1760-domain-containing protein [Nadsonia fulvescens var. elongata DSM 6958]|uniref:DUF1760-domain-containing protein n=1 Tax=Nadsonia fulvescens var. elongata DSM 6958 TaxID=857566 RepID=A0A1E3PJK2_9ASCO|nr:DUF1760-domain-containing protein [Nadsonia fulvescens var. elongata DSM 6958]
MGHTSDSDGDSDSATITALDYHEPPTLLDAGEIIDSLDSVATEAIETEDYLFFATFVEIQLYDSSRFDDTMRNEIMIKLAEVLHKPEHRILASKIGWDLPPLLIKYIESSYQFKSSLLNAPCVAAITSMMNLIAHENDPKVMFVLGLEMVSQLDFYSSDDGNYTIKVSERFFDLKFHLILELVRSSVSNIPSDHPSKLLRKMCEVILEFLARVTPKLTYFSTSILMRRFYTLIRDYLPGPVLSSQMHFPSDELSLIRSLLRNFLSHVVAAALHNISIKWSVRLFIEIRNDALKLPFEQRAHHADVAFAGSQIVDIITRYAQLMLSMDMEPENIIEYFKILSLDEFVKEYNTKGFDLSHPSLDGLLILVTQYTFDEHPQHLYVAFEENVIDFTSKFIMSRGTLPLIVRDAMGFWGWWCLMRTPNMSTLPALTDSVSLEINKIPLPIFKQYLNILMMLANQSALGEDVYSSSTGHQTRQNTPLESKVKYQQVMISLIGRLLTLRDPDDSWEWLANEAIRRYPTTKGRVAAVNFLAILLRCNSCQKTEVKYTTEELTSSMREVTLEDKKVGGNVNSRTPGHIPLTPERATIIYELFVRDINRAFDNTESTSPETKPKLIIEENMQILLAWLKLAHTLLDAKEPLLNYNGIVSVFKARSLFEHEYCAGDVTLYRGMRVMVDVLEKKAAKL